MRLETEETERLTYLVATYYAQCRQRQQLRELIREVVIEVLDGRLDQFLVGRPDLEVRK